MTRETRLGMALALVASTALLLGGCSGDGSDGDDAADSVTTTTAAEISEKEAIDIAVKAWQERDSDFDVVTVRPSVLQTEKTFDVAFVPTTIEGPGGEPHVVVDRITGEVVDIYQTK